MRAATIFYPALESRAATGLWIGIVEGEQGTREGSKPLEGKPCEKGRLGRVFWGEVNDQYTHGRIAGHGSEWEGYLRHCTRHVDGIDLSSKKGLGVSAVGVIPLATLFLGSSLPRWHVEETILFFCY
jgi:hypothetical protein